MSAVNRLVFQDHVKYIIDRPDAIDLILPITDPNKVILFGGARDSNSGFLDKWKYDFAILGTEAHGLAVAGWLCDNYPEIKGPSGLVFALPDNAMGHGNATFASGPYKAMGCNLQVVYFPGDQRDLSSLGTKIKAINPAWYMGNIGNVMDMALANSAAYDAGYRGHYFNFLTAEVGLMAPVFKPEVLEGFICGLAATETNPPLTQWAADLKNNYISKYGKWDFPDYMTSPCLLAIFAGIQQAGSIDTDQVANTLHHGVSFDVPDGSMTLIPRAEMRTNGDCQDGISDSSLKTIHNQQPVKLATFTYCRFNEIYEHRSSRIETWRNPDYSSAKIKS